MPLSCIGVSRGTAEKYGTANRARKSPAGACRGDGQGVPAGGDPGDVVGLALGVGAGTHDIGEVVETGPIVLAETKLG
jgi:hypothetical protein